MMKQLLSWLLLSTTVVPPLFAQAPSKQAPLAHQVIPPSPTAASLGVYGAIGVGYYNGTPDINIPLYTLHGRSIDLPLSLQYNASGTKAADVASWVGLHWSLSAGGVITRTVRGMDDFKDNAGLKVGYYNAPAFPATTLWDRSRVVENKDLSEADRVYYNELAAGTRDGDPDIYCYNFGPYSGKFLLGKRQDGSPVFVDERNNLQIDYTGQWRITDAKGYQFLFDQVETADNYSYSSDSDPAPNDIALSDLTYQADGLVTTAWYLSTITAPTGETMQFEYTPGKVLGCSASRKKKMI